MWPPGRDVAVGAEEQRLARRRSAPLGSLMTEQGTLLEKLELRAGTRPGHARPVEVRYVQQLSRACAGKLQARPRPRSPQHIRAGTLNSKRGAVVGMQVRHSQRVACGWGGRVPGTRKSLESIRGDRCKQLHKRTSRAGLARDTGAARPRYGWCRLCSCGHDVSKQADITYLLFVAFAGSLRLFQPISDSGRVEVTSPDVTALKVWERGGRRQAGRCAS